MHSVSIWHTRDSVGDFEPSIGCSFARANELHHSKFTQSVHLDRGTKGGVTMRTQNALEVTQFSIQHFTGIVLDHFRIADGQKCRLQSESGLAGLRVL